ncbi:MAG: NADH-quinone oxidoreductase subunit NuoN [Alphaproteobacteria bacterium]|nr:NADH-quinone oxidoreductase subunit NuoN [Alphaproteobacteria bacterium]
MTGEDGLLALPEISLALAAMAFLLWGVMRGNRFTRSLAWYTVAVFVLVIMLVLFGDTARVRGFGGLYVSDSFSVFMKVLILSASALCLILSLDYLERERMNRFEYPILLLLATLGMLMMVSANDLMSLYMGLEMQSLSLYVVAAFKRDTQRSTEAGLKYFVLGALSSGLLLYGASLVYGFSGTTSFEGIARLLAAEGPAPVGLVIGLVFVVAGLAFKVSAVPFHMWTPDVYEGAPTPITAFFAAAPKIAAMALFLRVMIGPFGGLVEQWQQVIVFVSLASMVLGALAALVQRNIKRLMAYSSIGHMGYALVGLAAGTETGVTGVILYMTIYMFMNVGTFACILCMRRQDRMVEQIDDLAGLAQTQPRLALAMAIFMFSMAGIPPLAGFFGKFFVFRAAIDAGLVGLAVVGVLASVVGAFYYLRIVKLMYFDPAADVFDRPIGREITGVLVLTSVFNVLFLAPLPWVMSFVVTAGQSLYLG